MGENPKTYQKVIETRGVYEICIDLNEGIIVCLLLLL
jgi:hypothetical protein